MEDQVDFVAYKFKKTTMAWWNQFQNIRMYQGKPPIRTWRQMKRLLQARSFTLKEEEIENQPQPFMRYYWSDKTIEPHQQSSIKDQSTKGDSSSTDKLETDTQPMNQSKGLEKKKSQISCPCAIKTFFMEPNKVEQGITLKEVSTTIKIPEEVDKSQECKGVMINKIEILPSMEDDHHYGMIILYNFEDPFLHKSAPDHIIQRFLDWNSKVSSFEEGGVDAGRKS